MSSATFGGGGPINKCMPFWLQGLQTTNLKFPPNPHLLGREDGLRLKRSAATDADQRVQTKGHAKKRKADADTPTETK